VFVTVGNTAKELTLEWIGSKEILTLFDDPLLVTNMPTFSVHHCSIVSQNISLSNLALFKGKL